MSDRECNDCGEDGGIGPFAKCSECGATDLCDSCLHHGLHMDMSQTFHDPDADLEDEEMD